MWISYSLLLVQAVLFFTSSMVADYKKHVDCDDPRHQYFCDFTLLFLLPYFGACRDCVVVFVIHVICTLPVSGASPRCTAASPACLYLQMLLLLLHRSSCLESGQTYFFNSGAENGCHAWFPLLGKRADIFFNSGAEKRPRTAAAPPDIS